MLAQRPKFILYGALAIGNVAMCATYNGLNGVLVPARIATIDRTGKIGAMAFISGVSAVFAVISNPISGAFSDRTRSRLGRRGPWLIAGSIGAFGTIIGLANARTITFVLIFQCMTQTMMNAYQAALTAIVPDRIPRERRGTASSVVGAGAAIGLVAGAVLAARFINSITGFLVLGSTVVVAALLIVLLAPELDPVGQDAPHPHKATWNQILNHFLSAFSHRDFMWVFAGRALMILSYNIVLLYLLYILQDYVIRPDGISPAKGVAILTAISVACSMAAILISGLVADKLARYRTFVFIAGIIVGIGLVIPIASRNWDAMIIFAAIEGLGIGIFLTVDTAIVTLVLPQTESAARDLGILNIANAGPPALAPIVASGVVLIAGYRPLFGVGCVIALAASFCILRVRSVD